MRGNEITLAELVQANTQGTITFLEYLEMLKFRRKQDNPKSVDWFAEEGQA